MRDTIKYGLILMLIAALSGAALALVYNITNPIIEKRVSGEANEAFYRVIDTADEFVEVDHNDVEYLLSYNASLIGVKEVFEAKNNGEHVGFAVVVETNGYGGLIKLIVGVIGETVTGFEVISHTETVGLGSKITDDSFRSQFIGIMDDSSLRVSKEGGRIDAISGATISSKAAVKGVSMALEAANFLDSLYY